MGSRRTIRLLAVAALSLGVITLVAGALWMIGSASGTRDRFSSLEIAPSDSVFYMAINTEPSSSQWIAVSDILGRVNAKDPVREAIDKELLQFGLQFERDILPLAGDEGYIAITDVDALVAENGGFVAAFRLRDGAKAEEVTLAVAEGEGTAFTEEVYEGVTIRQTKGTAANNYQDEGALSFVNDVMIVGAAPNDVKGVIDVIQGRAENALTDSRLREMRERQEEDFLLWGYADLTQLWGFLETYFKENAPEDFQDSFSSEQFLRQARENYDRLTFSVSSRDEGFVLDYSYVVPQESSDRLGLGVPFDSRFAERVPADTMFFFAANQPYDEGYLPGREELDTSLAPGGQTLEEIIQDIERELGFDLQDDLLSLMSGEIAVAGNVSDLSSDEQSFELLALAEVNDMQKMENTMRKLGEFLERQELAIVEDSDRNGVHRWSPMSAPDSAAWTVTGEDVIVGYPEAAVEGFLDGKDESLADTADWKRTMEILPKDGTSLMYISLARSIEELRIFETAEAEFEESTDGKVTFDDLAPIRALGAATTTTDDGYSARLVLLIAD